MSDLCYDNYSPNFHMLIANRHCSNCFASLLSINHHYLQNLSYFWWKLFWF